MSDKTQKTAAQERFNEMVEVYGSAAATVRDLIARIDAGDEMVPKKLAGQITVLHDLFLRVRKAEDTFLENEVEGTKDGDIDFNSVRTEIGRKLDRIRAAGRTNGVSE